MWPYRSIQFGIYAQVTHRRHVLFRWIELLSNVAQKNKFFQIQIKYHLEITRQNKHFLSSKVYKHNSFLLQFQLYLVKTYILVLIDNGLLTWMYIQKFCFTSDIFIFLTFLYNISLFSLFILAKFVEEIIYVFRNFNYISLFCSCCEL